MNFCKVCGFTPILCPHDNNPTSFIEIKVSTIFPDGSMDECIILSTSLEQAIKDFSYSPAMHNPDILSYQ